MGAQEGAFRRSDSDDEDRPARGLVLSGDLTVVRFDNGAGNGQPHAHALRLGGEERIKDLLRLPPAIPGPVSPTLISA